MVQSNGPCLSDGDSCLHRIVCCEQSSDEELHINTFCNAEVGQVILIRELRKRNRRANQLHMSGLDYCRKRISKHD